MAEARQFDGLGRVIGINELLVCVIGRIKFARAEADQLHGRRLHAQVVQVHCAVAQVSELLDVTNVVVVVISHDEAPAPTKAEALKTRACRVLRVRIL